MNFVKDTIGKIRTECGNNKVEVILLLLFICAFVILNGPEIAREASVMYGSGDGFQGTGTITEETETETGTEDSSAQTEEAETESNLASEEEAADETAELTPEGRSRLERRTLSRFGADFRIPMAMPAWYEEENPDGEILPEDAEPAGSSGTSEDIRLEYRELRDWQQLHGYSLLTPEQASWYGLVVDAPASEDGQEEDSRDLALLKRVIENQLSGYDGDWSVYMKNLTTNESFIVNDRPMKSASIMKLFVMGAVYRAFESGELERTDENMSLVSSMISNSDNEATNQLLYRLGGSASYAAGIAQVNAFIQEYGFSDLTIEYNGFNNPDTNTGSGNYNQVAAKDCGKLLEDIYRRTWVNRTVSNEMEQLLLNQSTRYKIPAALPEGVLCGNKTGEMDTTENDAAIIYSDSCDYILVVLSSDWNSKDQAISRIQEISGIVYEYLN